MSFGVPNGHGLSMTSRCRLEPPSEAGPKAGMQIPKSINTIKQPVCKATVKENFDQLALQTSCKYVLSSVERRKVFISFVSKNKKEEGK